LNKSCYEEEIGNDKIVIRPFRNSDAKGVARLYNESDNNFPGGLTRGVPFTAERVQEQLERENALVQLLIFFNRCIIGICTVSIHRKDKNATYVSFLNLHPKYHGQGFGRRLLYECVKHVINLGFERLDINTWPGNLKAVPLYKKMGFFWVPGTRVFMQNYVPAILRYPVAKEFFNKHPEWYSNMQRNLKVEEDNLEDKGMKIFTYEWRKDNDILKVTVDREVFAIAGIEDNRISVMCRPTEHEAPAGFRQKVEWEIRNKTEEPFKCSMLVSCEEDLQLIRKPQETFTVEPFKTVTLEGEVKIDAKSRKKDDDDPAHKVETKLFVNETMIPLTFGMRVKQPVDLNFDPEYLSSYSGCEGELKVTIKSNVKQAIKGNLYLVPHPSVKISPINQPFETEKEGYAGATFKIRIPDNVGTLILPLRFYATIKAGEEEVKTEEKVYQIKSFAPGGILAAIEDDGQTLTLENEVSRIVIGLHRGGRLHSFHGKLLDTFYATSLNDSLGPPFWPTEIALKDFHYEILKEEGALRARLYADLETFEGLRIIKDVTLFPSTELMKVQYSFVNSSFTKRHDFQFRLGTYGNMSEAKLVIPLKQGILSSMADGDFPYWAVDIPEKPESLSETWFCLEYPKSGEISGILWHPENIVSNKMGAAELTFKPEAVEPQSTVTLKPIYIVGGFGTWQKVSQLWRLLIKGQGNKEITYQKVKEKPLVEAKIEPSIIEDLESFQAKVMVFNNRENPLSGDVTLKSPTGLSIKPRTFKIKNIKLDKPYEKPVFVTLKLSSLGIYDGSIKIESNLTTIETPFHLLALGKKGTVKVEKLQEQGKQVFCIDNGRLQIKICPDLAGSVYSLIDKKTGVNHLLSAFPERKPYSFQNPWFGGIRFSAWMDNKYDKLYDEEFQCEKAERNGWIGVKITSRPEKHVIDLKGIIIEGYYLTKPESNIIARILRITNLTSARLNFRITQDTFIKAGGTIENNIAYLCKDRKILKRKRTQTIAWIVPDESWLQATNEKTGDSLVVISTATERSRPVMQDWGILGINLSTDTNVVVDPEKPLELLSYLVLSEKPDAYRQYKILEDYFLK